MSFLTPLYLLGLAAVSLPLIFHLIRRTPKGRYSFSTLMFLTPSPPRLTRRSRIDNWLLLLLRVSALILLAAAFARPFLRSIAQLGVADIAGRKIAILVDTSASMQREGLWTQVVQKVDEVLDDLGPGDDVALYRFAADHEVLLAFDEGTALGPAQKIAQLREALQATSPGWSGSNLGDALVAVADEVDQLGSVSGTDTQTVRQIVLVSDLQEGARIEALRTYHWPDDVDLVVRPVAPVATTNAGIHLAAALEDTPGEDLRIRVNNGRDSERDQFTLHWEDKLGRTVNAESINIYVPSGESRVVRVPLPPADPAVDRLVLMGDDHDFDNTLFRIPSQQHEWQLIYLGDDDETDETGLRYYLKRAFPETPRKKVRLISHSPGDPMAAEELHEASMLIVAAALPQEQADRLKQYLKEGGCALIVLKDTAPAPTLAELLGHAVSLEEVEPTDYAMFGQIDFSDPLFAPFADPRFNDFTKIHFWRYRRVTLPDDWSGKTLARFDTGDPLLLEQTIGNGRVWVLTTGWHPKDSHLSRSSKFVPLLAGMLERSTDAAVVLPQYDVGDSVLLPPRRDSSVAGSVRTPDGATLELAADSASFNETSLPGIYSLAISDVRQRFAVNVPADESRTARMSEDELGQRGVAPGRPVTRAEMADELRQMRDVELESRQKLWRWLIAAALAILILETWLASRLARQAVEPVETGA